MGTMKRLTSRVAYVALIVATLSMVAAAVNAYYTYQSNRMTGYLKITAVHDTEDRYGTRGLGQLPPVFLRTDPGVRLDIRNTGRFNEQIIGIGYGRHQKEGDLESLDPQIAKDLQMRPPDELQEFGFYPKNSDEFYVVPPASWHRLPINIPAGESESVFWGLSDPEDQMIREEASYLWLDTARETIRVPIRRQRN